VLCHEVDFQRGGFGPRTIMLCDQCEREFHVGCLKKCGTCELEAVPEGEQTAGIECGGGGSWCRDVAKDEGNACRPNIVPPACDCLARW
jgi:hypothetical protein